MEEIKISLAAARVNAGLTQEEVASLLGKSKQTIINWEKGKSAPGILEIEALEKIFHMPRKYIFLPSYSTNSRFIEELNKSKKEKS